MQKNKTFWPYGIVISIFAIVCSCAYTIYYSLDYPVHMDDYYFDKYQKVDNVPNSMSILTDLLPTSIDMSIKKVSGIMNFVNPGVISHNEILDLYKEYIDPSFTYVNFSLEEQAKILKAGRSNNELDT